MKAPATAIALLFISAVFLYSQRIPDNWWENTPRDTATHVFSMGVSTGPRATEQEARMDAEQNAEFEFARKTASLVVSNYKSLIQRDGEKITRDEAIEQTYLSTRLLIPKSGRIFKIKQMENGVLGFCLIYVAKEEADKAELWAQNELTALYAYNYLSQRVPGIKSSIADNYEGLPHLSWIKLNCGILSISGGNNQMYYLNLLDSLIREIIPGVVFAGSYDGRPSRFVYDTKNIEFVSRVLLKHGIEFVYGGIPVLLTVKGSQKLEDLMKLDPSVIFVAGVERVHHTQMENTQVLGKELVSRLQTGTRKKVTLYTLPMTFSDEMEILEFLTTGKLSCRYLIAYAVQTTVEPERAEFRMPAYFFASGRVVVYDQWSGDTRSIPIKNGIPIGENDLAELYKLLSHRLISSVSFEALKNSIGGE